uniref:PDZ domain-containing protein n=1 Tax=Branchiostoma floridae TaxID=7739 RepID=C3ZFX0_BRAFL|eukprot:XP_002592597.1 hypothetical protein BRAFLDRAFT_68920 [Branchiostoma floridae]
MPSGQQYQVTLPGPAPWGFRLTGGSDFNLPLTIYKVTPGSLAAQANVNPGDVVLRIGSCIADTLTYSEANTIIKANYGALELILVRGDGTVRPLPPPPTGPLSRTTQGQPAFMYVLGIDRPSGCRTSASSDLERRHPKVAEGDQTRRSPSATSKRSVIFLGRRASQALMGAFYERSGWTLSGGSA